MTEQQQDDGPDPGEHPGPATMTPEQVNLANDLDRRFASHPADTGSRRMAHEEVRRLCHSLAARLADLVPPGRERSLALTACEEAMFWSNAGIARLYPSADGQGHASARLPRQTEARPVPNGTHNPAHLVETDDMQPGRIEPQTTEDAPADPRG